jgi:LysM repeat protein
MTMFPSRLMAGVSGLLVCLAAISCESTTKKTGYEDVVDYTSPNTRMSKEEFPFDEQGNYREDWAAAGAGVRGVKDKPTGSPYVQEPDASERTKVAARRSTATTTAATARPATTTVATTTATVRTSGTGTGSTTVASAGSSGGSTPVSRSTASSSRPKPKPKPKPKPLYVKVKSGDTLYSYSKRYGVSIAAIKAANGLTSDLIIDGKSLKIPKKL